MWSRSADHPICLPEIVLISVEKQLHPICDKDDRWDQVKVFCNARDAPGLAGQELEIAGSSSANRIPASHGGDNCIIGVKICQLQFLLVVTIPMSDKRAEGEKVQAPCPGLVGSDLLGYSNTLTVVCRPIDQVTRQPLR